MVYRAPALDGVMPGPRRGAAAGRTRDMGHDHDHGAAKSRRALVVALALTASYTAVEVVGGLLTGSLALLADAVHMLSDNVAIALALAAVWLSARPATPERTFGYRRAEVLAALANGVTLVALAIWIFYAAITRFEDPPDVLGGWMLAIAIVGVAVNLGSGAFLYRARDGSLNVEAAFRHVIADVLGSLGVVVAALVILLTGWLEADAVVSILICILILASSWTIMRDSTGILLEAAPRDVDTRAVGERLAHAPGVVDVHDLHIWTITSGFPALSAHVLVGRGEDCHARRRELELILAREFRIEHTTLQVEHAVDPDGLVELGRF
jgi:cobalt-zinc-cadmium efflux system protein